MCKYQYKNKNRNRNRKCFYPALFKAREKSLVLDEDGFCLFHSQNLDWKKSEGFEKIVIELLTYLEVHPWGKGYESNLSGFVFIAEKTINLFSNSTYKRRINLAHCIFHNALQIERMEVAGIDISNATFKQKIVFKEVKFTGAFYATSTNFQNGLYIQDCFFLKDTYFEKSNFQNLANKSSTRVIFKSCVFERSLDFRRCNFELRVSFSQLNLQETEFTEAQFLKECYFEDITINKTVQFDKTEFLYTEVVGGYYSSLDFQKLQINETGKIIFRGKEPFYDQVKGEVYIDFAEPPKGTIFIENFDLNKFENKAKLKLLELEKSEVVTIGAGCRKYKNQTRPKRIEIQKGNQSLVTELTNTFVEFFINKNGLNLGVEITGRGEDYIEIIYFSDEGISEQTFLEMLKVTETEMWQLVKVRHQSVQTIPLKETLPDKVIIGTDAIVNLIGLILKIGFRIPMGKISRQELDGLIHSTSFGGTADIQNSTFETLNINQTIMLGIGNTQKIDIK